MCSSDLAFEIRQVHYRAVMGVNPSAHEHDQNPVESVSWADAVEFCETLSGRDEERMAGRSYRLPTEAEWEYACRAGTTSMYHFADEQADLSNHAWFKTNASAGPGQVGRKSPNAWGLYDMHGNVWEWCLDWYASYPGGSVMDPSGPPSGADRVYRGGSWGDVPAASRASFRNGRGPEFHLGSLGLRVALTPAR